MDKTEAKPCTPTSDGSVGLPLASFHKQDETCAVTCSQVITGKLQEDATTPCESTATSTQVNTAVKSGSSSDSLSKNVIAPATNSSVEKTVSSTEEGNNHSPVTADTLCRICFGGRDQGVLLRACNCKGSIGFAHEACLAQWLQTRGETKCEICKAPYRRSFQFRQWWKRLPQVLFDDDAAFRGLFLANILWMCLYFIIMATIPPQSYVVKQVFECVFCIMIILLAITLAVLLKQGCIFASTMTQSVFRHRTIPRLRLSVAGRRRYLEIG